MWTMRALDRITAVLCAIGVAMAGAALSLGSRLDQHPASAHVRHVTVRHHHQPPPQPLSLPFTIDPLGAAAAVACCAVLAAWCWWQRSHRCGSCGYCPAFCRCDELPDGA
jgi:hypothetical protein